jgi:NAD(P)-dependent dehydrogenase (short-subunit alcohol dehydrogenase family)
VKFGWHSLDVPDQYGRRAIVTGANTGLGYQTALALAAAGAEVVMAVRDLDRGQAAAQRIRDEVVDAKLRIIHLDLADLRSVHDFAVTEAATGPVDLLVNNAGLMLVPSRVLTRDGFESQMGVNHLGHFALTAALADRLASSAPARVVTVASDAHYSAPGIDFGALQRPARGITGLREYAVSKLCNVLFAQELARRTAGTAVRSYALHPGVVASDMWRRVPWPVRPLITRRMLTVEEGAATSLYCATSSEVAGDSGLFYDSCAPREPSPAATPELGRELWRRSDEWTAAYLA